MSIATQMSLTGFFATAPELHLTAAGKECLRARVGVQHFRKEVDGSFTELDKTFHNLVMFEATARNAYHRFCAGDSFVASGYIHEYEVDRGAATDLSEEFVARKIGHDVNLTPYEVQRPRGASMAAPALTALAPVTADAAGLEL
jgi:single-strand DNA-binding protein